MALSWVARQHGKARLTVVTIADIAADTPGLSGHLSSDDSVTHSRANSADVVSSWPQSTPCVLVADVSCVPSINLARIRTATDSGRSVRTLIVVDEDDPELCERLLRMGFDGAIERSAPPAIFRRALHAVAEGELWAPRKRNFRSPRKRAQEPGDCRRFVRQSRHHSLASAQHLCEGRCSGSQAPIEYAFGEQRAARSKP